VSDETPWVANEFAIGSRVAGYRLDEEIGRGGMAVVYRAHDPRLDRRVALKVLAPELARDEGFRRRFIRESRTAAAVDHPHIIPVFEAGESGGVLFIAMRYVEGGDVGTLINRAERLPVARVVHIITQVASALDAAHARGLVHRDVKPGNILLDSSAAADHVYLSDFGLSKQALSSSHLTATGQFLGTLDYVAPEQIESHPVDGRTDLYALACATFEMLSGTPPFKRDQRLAVLWAQLSEPPPALTARRGDLPPAVDQVLAKALAKSPGDRYQTCLEFAAALRSACGLGTGDATSTGSGAGDASATGLGTGDATATGLGTGDATATGLATGDATGGDLTVPSRRPATEAPGHGDPGPATPVPPRPATEAVRAVRRPREVLRPGTAPRAGTAGAGTAGAGTAGAGTAGAGTAGAGTAGAARPGWSASARPPAHVGDRPAPPAPPAPPARPWWRSPVALVAGCVVLLGLAGGSYALARGGGSSGGGGKASSSGTVALSPPGCLVSNASAPPLPKIRTTLLRVPGQPWAVVTAKGSWSFLTLTSGSQSSIAVIRNGTGLAPALVRTIAVAGTPRGATLTPDGHYLLAADGSGAVVIDVAQAEQGGPNPVSGSLTSPGGSGGDQVRVTPDGRFAFVTLQRSNAVAVFDLHAAIASGFGSSHFVGTVPLGLQPVGMSVSPDGHWLYATTQNRSENSQQGGLSVIDVHHAETDPATALKATVSAGCVPIRVITTGAGQYVWVTARDSNTLLAFSAAKLLSDPRHALIARARVGQGPIGLTTTSHGDRIIVADSNLYTRKGATANLIVVNSADVLAGKPALLGVIPAGLLPRQFAMEPDSTTLLVTDSTSQQLQAVDVTNLP
jgi:DNA-binding beta-propeller fold protein YncE